MESTKRLLSITIIISSSISVVLFGAGYIAGRYAVVKTFSREIHNTSKTHTLKRVLEIQPEKAEGITRAYYDGDKILGKMDDISWAVPSIPSPFVGDAPTPGVHGVAHINSMQFRADREVVTPKPDNTYRIFITGGSTAYGSGAPSQDRTIAGYLSKLLSESLSPITKLNYEIFTVANPAWSSTHERIMIENRLSELEPDLIISFSGANDVHWGNLGRNVLWFRSYSDEFFLRLIKEAYGYADQPAIPENVRTELTPIPPAMVIKRLMRNVKLSCFALSEENIGYVFVLQPTLAITNKRLTNREQKLLKDQAYFRQCYAQIDGGLKNIQGKNYQYVNLTDIFDGVGDQEDIFLDSYHFGDKGNEAIAKNIFSRIKNKIEQ